MRGGEVGSGEYSRGRILFVAVRARREFIPRPRSPPKRPHFEGGRRRGEVNGRGDGAERDPGAGWPWWPGGGGGVRQWSYAAKLGMGTQHRAGLIHVDEGCRVAV